MCKILSIDSAIFLCFKCASNKGICILNIALEIANAITRFADDKPLSKYILTFFVEFPSGFVAFPPASLKFISDLIDFLLIINE